MLFIEVSFTLFTISKIQDEILLLYYVPSCLLIFSFGMILIHTKNMLVELLTTFSLQWIRQVQYKASNSILVQVRQ